MSKKIVVVGSINIDLVASVPRMPGSGETLAGSAFATYSGGKGANQAVAAARLGGEVSMVGCLGSDLFAERLRHELDAVGVDTSHVRNKPGPSGSAVILVTPDGANAIVVIPGANGELHATDLDACRDLLAGAGAVLAQLEIPLATVTALAAMARELNVPFVLDPAPAQALSRELLGLITWLTPNETESRSLLGGDGASKSLQPAAVAEQLLAAGVQNVILKLGSQGVYLAGRDVEKTFVPSFAVAAIDTTAAGDAFNGGFAYALVAGHAPVEAARFACAVAAVSVTRAGAQPSMPRLSEVEALLGESGAAGALEK